jgi:hypothetical protein
LKEIPRARTKDEEKKEGKKAKTKLRETRKE